MSKTRKLLIAALCGSVLGLIPYVWGRYQAARFIVPVSGQVILNGKPLAHTYVKFAPVPRPGQNPLDTNPGSHAYTDGEGYFTLQQIENDQPGVLVGEHKVLMRSGTGGQGPEGYVNERVPFSWRKGLRKHYVSWTGPRLAVFRIETVTDCSPRNSSLPQDDFQRAVQPASTEQ